MSSTRGKTTPNSTQGSWAPHAGQKSRLHVPSELGTCTKCDSPLTPINESDEFDTRAGEPGDTRCSDHTCPLSDTEQPAAADTAAVAALVDPMIAAQTPMPVRPRYVICVRDPDSSNEFHSFNSGDGDIEILDIDLGATLEHAGEDEYTDFVHNHLAVAATIADSAARGKYLSEVRSVITNAIGDYPELLAAIEYMNDQPVRRVIAFQSALSFHPQAIREHFHSETDPIGLWVAGASDAQLADVATNAILDDRLYETFHSVLADAVTSTITEQDDQT